MKQEALDDEYFDKDFFWSHKSIPPKGATRGIESPHDRYWVNAVLEVFGGKNYSFLDVGCGLGWVIKILRERNETAFGVDISSYAIENSCMPDYVRLGNVVTLKSHEIYDVVLCNRVLCYLDNEADAVTALKNLKNLADKYLIVAVSASDHKGPGNAERAMKSRKKLFPKSKWMEWFEKAGLAIDTNLTDRIVKQRLHWDCIWVFDNK